MVILHSSAENINLNTDKQVHTYYNII